MNARIKHFGFQGGESPEVEVVDLQTLLARHRKAISVPHRTDFYHVFLFGDCSPTHCVDFRSIAVRPHSLLFVDRDQIHQFDPVAEYRGKALIFTAPFFCISESDAQYLQATTLFNQLLREPMLSGESVDLRRLLSICDFIQEELTLRHSANPLILKNLVHNLLLLADREKQKHVAIAKSSSTELERTLSFKALIETHYRAHKRVAYYSRSLLVQEKQLNRATLRTCGRTPKQMIDDRLLLEARRLLAHGHRSVREIADFLGFDEPTNFAKYFRKHAGVSPIEFRTSTRTRQAGVARSG